MTGSPAQGDGARFRYLAEPALSALSSRAGAASGGTVAAVRGRAFVDDDKESDRGVVPACFVSSAELECIVPRASCGRPGAVALAVSLNGGADFDGGDSSSMPGARRARVRVRREHRRVVARAARRAPARRAAPRSASSAKLRALARTLVPVRRHRERRHRERRRRRGDRRGRVLLSIQLRESARRRRRCGARRRESA